MVKLNFVHTDYGVEARRDRHILFVERLLREKDVDNLPAAQKRLGRRCASKDVDFLFID